jgi:hypothetical protein
MRTNDFTSPISSKQLNESMFKKFGVKVNFDKYDRAQLENFRNLLRTKLHQTETSSNFNALLNNESYQKDKFMVDLLNTRIKEMLGEGKKKGDGNLANNAKPYDKITRGDVIAGRLGKDEKGGKKVKEATKFDHSQYDGDREEPADSKSEPHPKGHLNKALRKKLGEPEKKNSKVKEGKASAAEMAHHHAMEYAKHHKMGNLEMAQHHRDACESCGGKVTHSDMGEAFHSHQGMNNGQPYKCEEGVFGGIVGGLTGLAVGGLPGAGIGYAAGSKAGDDLASESRGVKEGKKLSAKQKKVMDKDHDDDIDAKDLAKLRKENMSRKQKAGITESIARYIAEDEEGKAKSITAGLDMVNDFTSWMQRIATYQTKSMIELSDEIRAHFGDAEAQTFKQETYAALEQSLTALTQSREQLSNAVAVLAGEAPAQEPMGSDPMASPDDMSMQEPGMEEPEALPAPDEFASADAAAGGPETTGRMKRESIERGNRLMKILGA